MNMPFGVSAMTYTYARYSLPFTLSSIARLGLSEVEIWGNHPHAPVDLMDTPYLSQVQYLLSKEQLGVSMYTPEQLSSPVSIGSSNDTIRAHSIRYFCRAADAAAELGTHRMLMTSGTILKDEHPKATWHRSLDSLKIIAEHAQRKGVSLVLEPLAPEESPMMCSLKQVKEAFDELASLNAKVMVDLVPMVLCGDTLEEYFQVFGDDLSVIHFIDCDGTSIRHLVPGEGIIDFPKIMRTLNENRFAGSVSLELGEAYHSEPEDALRRSLDTIDRLLDPIR